MKISLTKEQKKHFKSIQWLFNGQRASGRTTLLAYVLIETVMSTRQTMRIIDHYPDKRADRILTDIIERIIAENNLPLVIDFTGLRLIYK